MLKTVDEPAQPAVVMLVHSNEMEEKAAICLGKQLVEIGSQSIKYDTELDVPVAKLQDGASFANRAALHDGMQADLGAANGFFLNGVEKLGGNTAMALHSFCDNINAPFKRAVIILLVRADEKRENEVLDDVIEIALGKSWSSELDVDKISPLLSRITVSATRVKAEAGEKC